jgi:hypothetical protein
VPRKRSFAQSTVRSRACCLRPSEPVVCAGLASSLPSEATVICLNAAMSKPASSLPSTRSTLSDTNRRRARRDAVADGHQGGRSSGAGLRTGRRRQSRPDRRSEVPPMAENTTTEPTHRSAEHLERSQIRNRLLKDTDRNTERAPPEGSRRAKASVTWRSRGAPRERSERSE